MPVPVFREISGILQNLCPAHHLLQIRKIISMRVVFYESLNVRCVTDEDLHFKQFTLIVVPWK